MINFRNGVGDPSVAPALVLVSRWPNESEISRGVTNR